MAADTFVCLDVGERRIGVATADSGVRIAVAQGAVEVDGSELDVITKMIQLEGARVVIVGYPRNQSGETTGQTEFVEAFTEKLKAHRDFSAEIVFQDESLTSVLAEKYLDSLGKPYSKGDVDTQAARIIMEDYLGERYG